PPPRPAVPPPMPPTAVQQQPPPRRQPAEVPLEERDEVILEEPAYDDDRPRKKGMKTRQRMRLANIGLAFHYAKILCIIVSLLLILFLFVVAPLIGIAAASGSREGLSAGIGVIQVASCLSFVLMLATPLLGGTGS